LARQACAREVVAEPRHAAGRDVDRGHVGAGGAELHGLAAGRGAEVGDLLARDVAQQARRQGSGGVLHPPGALGEARQLGDVAAAGAAERAGRQLLGLELSRPEIGVGARREVERRLDQVGGSDGACRGFAVGLDPALPQPARRVEAGGVAIHQKGVAVARDAPQHGIHQALEVMQAGILDQPHRGIDGGMRRRSEEDELGGAEAQDLGADGVGAFERPLDQRVQHLLDLAQAAQGGGEQ